MKHYQYIRSCSFLRYCGSVVIISRGVSQIITQKFRVTMRLTQRTSARTRTSAKVENTASSLCLPSVISEIRIREIDDAAE